MNVNEACKTPLFHRHVALDANMTDFAGWAMPVHYPAGIVAEHLATRKHAGLFDVSHMGRFYIEGPNALTLLQHALTNNVASLRPNRCQYTMIANCEGGAIDDAYLYQLAPYKYLLVVNASNREQDWKHLESLVGPLEDVTLTDRTDEGAMLALQGPRARDILEALAPHHASIPAHRNTAGSLDLAGMDVYVACTGYTGEPIGYEFFLPADAAGKLWDECCRLGATPVGLGARDTLRLEDSLPLHGHELGLDSDGKQIPIFACPLASRAVSFAPEKGDFIGRDALEAQANAWQQIKEGRTDAHNSLPCRVRNLAVFSKAIPRPGAKVFHDGKPVGVVTSGTSVPYWITASTGLSTRLTDHSDMRPVALALLDSRLALEESVDIEIRDQKVPARIVRRNLNGLMPPYAHPILHDQTPEAPAPQPADAPAAIRNLLAKSIDNHLWRQNRCINLIPSEQTPSVMTRRLSVLDPVGRYAEHRIAPEMGDIDVYYYQGTDFIREVESLLEAQLREYLGCSQVETRIISGQMANAAVFSSMVDFVNRSTPKKEQRRRLGPVMNNHIIRGGHLSAQPMGALHDFIARDLKTGKSAVVNFPVCDDNLYRIDVEKTLELLEQHRPEFIIFGKSMVLHPEPVAEIRRRVDELRLPTVIMYDMAHVLGLVGPYFQQPFADGAHIVTGSTHKTFFGTQRGIVASNIPDDDSRAYLNDAIRRRAFPGSVSNHHLGSLLGLLVAATEMNTFKDDYQKNVVENAKAFAKALVHAGLRIEGDPAVDYTQTHQVIVKVGYARGPEMAAKLEENNIICNYQATPEEDGFSTAGALRLGVQEMTRFGMKKPEFESLAQFMADIILHDKPCADDVAAFRARFLTMQYTFTGHEIDALMQKIHQLV